jgi:hypothetical protein
MEDEASCAELHDRHLLTRFAADPFVFRENDPPSAPSFLESSLVVGVWGEAVVVSDDVWMHLAQSIRDLPSTQAAVDEEFRQRGVRGTELRL